ncbi:MAG: polysaccharide biosynthesis tyrosine autokinase [Gammaproteobacteria bacterium]|nr:polysaccharide biosynthesis tyrosine autokinase [Gammaproteobacteria bacterium]
MHLTDYWRLIRRHKWMIVGLTIVGLIVGWLQALSETPIYRAQLTLVIEPERANLSSIGEGLVLPFTYRFYETQYQILQSRAVAERVVDKLGLADRDPVVNPPVKRRRLGVFEALHKIATDIKQRLGVSVSDPGVAPEETNSEDSQQEISWLASLVTNGLSVSGGEDSQIVVLSYDSPDPQLSAEIVNAVAESYVEFTLQTRVDRSRRAGSWLTQQLEQLRARVVESEVALQQFQSREGMVDLDSRKALTGSKLETLNQESVRAQTKYAELAKRYGPKHPKIVAAKAELDAARSRLQTESTTVVDTREKEFTLAKLERQVVTNRQLYDLFLTRLNETDLSTDDKLSNVHILDAAQVPAAPHKPDEMRIVTIWSLVGLILGLLIAYLREHLDNTFGSDEQVEEKLDRPVLGVLPLLTKHDRKISGRKTAVRLGQADQLVPERYFIDYGQSSFAESVNHIRTGILYANIDDPPKIILISSSVQGEGKTTLATNLSLSLSQLAPTLLVDADLRKRRVGEIVDTDKLPGLVEFVADAVSLKDCLVQDRDSKDLYILRSGAVPPNPLELLSSKKLQNAFIRLKEKFEYVVVDTAPVLPVSDAIVLGHIVDAMIMVLHADRTTHTMARDALRRFNAANVEPLGVVLSQLNQRKASYHYGRYQYYYPGYYSDRNRGQQRA